MDEHMRVEVTTAPAKKPYPRIYKEASSSSDSTGDDEELTTIDSALLFANVRAGREFIVASPTMFETMNGSVFSVGTTVVQFKFPKLKADPSITHRFEVIEDSSDAMVIGRDLMNALGLFLNFKDKTVQWDDCSLSLNTGHSGAASADDERLDHKYPEEVKDATDCAWEPEQLLPDNLDPEQKQAYLELL